MGASSPPKSFLYGRTLPVFLRAHCRAVRSIGRQKEDPWPQSRISSSLACGFAVTISLMTKVAKFTKKKKYKASIKFELYINQ